MIGVAAPEQFAALPLWPEPIRTADSLASAGRCRRMSGAQFVVRAYDRLRSGDAAGAEQLLRDGLVRSPRSIEGWCSLSDTLTRRHAYEEALAATARALEAEPGDPRALIARARTLRSTGRPDDALRAFTEALSGRALPEPLRAYGLMELGRTLDELGRTDEAWAAITEGQELRRGMTAAGQAHWLSDRLTAMQSWLDVRVPTPAVPWDDLRPRPIFVVGVPGSGATLVEQILIAAGAQSTAERPVLSRAVADVVESDAAVAYPDGLHEWPESVVHAVRERFFARVDMPRDVPVLHKLPLDLLHLGLVHRVFEGAPVVQALRDPRDTLISGYFQNLVLDPAMNDWTEPRQLALATCSLLQLGRRYGEELEGLVLRVQRYDRLTDDPDREPVDLVEHCGLPFTSEVSRLHEGARTSTTPSSHAVIEPVHRRARSGGWRRYERQLAVVLPLLEPIGAELGFG